MGVRLEKVVLDLEDKFTTPMMRAAAATKTLDQSLNSLDGTTVKTDRDMDRLGSGSGSLAKAAVQSRTLNKEIDRTSGRLRVLVDAAILLGPALIPIGAVALPAITGLAAQFGAAALAGGAMIVAFQGVGDTLGAVNKAALEPTAANIEAAQIAMQNLAPETREFVRQIQDMRPAFVALRDAAAAGLFPGLSDFLDEMQSVFPQVERILYAVGDAAGDLAENFAEGLAGERGREFLRFVETEVPRALADLGRIVGNLVGGMGELWMAFTPLNNDFSNWLVDASRAFDDWAQGLSQTQGFQDFVAYIRENGPKVADAMGSIGNAVLQIVQAAAPLGGPVLTALTAFADTVAAIAGSGVGAELVAIGAGFVMVSRAVKTIEAIKASTLFAGISGGADEATRKMSGLQRAAFGVAGAVAGIILLDDAIDGLLASTRDAMPGMEELTGQLLDLQSGAAGELGGFGNLAEDLDFFVKNEPSSKWVDWIPNITGLLPGENADEQMERLRGEFEALDLALANIARSGSAEQAKSALEAFADAQGLSADQQTALIQQLPEYQEALAGAANEAKLTGVAGAEAGRRAAQGFQRATSAAQEFRSAIEEANRILEGRASVRDYEQSIDNLRKSLKDNGRTLDINTQKGRDNQAALDDIVQSTLQVAEGMSATNRVPFLRQARRDFVDATSKLLGGDKAARQLWDRLTQLDGVRAAPTIDISVADAVNDLMRVQGLINAIPRYIAVTIEAQRRGNWTGSGPGLADGGTVPGPRYPYRDKLLVMLAPGEEVITNRNGEADRFRADRASGRIPRYAEGGTIGAPTVNVGSPAVSVGGTSVRVLIGDRELRDIVRSEIDADRSYDDTLGRMGARR